MKSVLSQNLRRKRILAIHGFTGEPYDFAPLYESDGLDVDWRFVSLPGHYREIVPDSAYQDEWELFCRRIEEIVQEASEDGVELIALGYSMGARLLLRATLERRLLFTRLILIGVTPGLKGMAALDERKESDEGWCKLLIEQGIDVFLEKWRQQPIIATQYQQPDAESHTRRERKRRLDPKALAAAMMRYSNGVMPHVWDQLDELDLPVLLVSGERDEKFSAIHQQMEACLPQGTAHSIPNAGHAPHLENTTAFVRFLSTLVEE